MMKRNRTKKEFVNYNDYIDRPFGLKWGTAFALAELTDSITANKTSATKIVKELPLMSRVEIDNVLQEAFLKSKKVEIQLNIRDQFGNLLESVVGKFEGFADETTLYLDTTDVLWEDIRNIKINK